MNIRVLRTRKKEEMKFWYSSSSSNILYQRCRYRRPYHYCYNNYSYNNNPFTLLCLANIASIVSLSSSLLLQTTSALTTTTTTPFVSSSSSSGSSSIRNTAFIQPTTSFVSSWPFISKYQKFPQQQQQRICQYHHPSSSLKMSTTTSESSSKEQQQPSVLQVAVCQFHVTEDKLQNLQTCSTYIDNAMIQQQSSSEEDHNNNNNNKNTVPNLIVLPEIWNSPYATTAFVDYAEPIPDVVVGNNNDDESLSSTTVLSQEETPSLYMLQQKAKQYSIYIVGGSIPEIETSTGTLYNTCVVFHPNGTIIAKHRKVHLFDINVPNGITFYESDTLSSGSQITYFTTPWCNIGIGICYDIRFVEYAMLLSQSCSIIIYPGAFNTITGPAHWELLQRCRAVDTQCYIITASPARTILSDEQIAQKKYPHYNAYGHSTIVAPWGNIIATTNEMESIVSASIDLQNVTNMRQSIPIRNQKRTDLYTLQQQQPK